MVKPRRKYERGVALLATLLAIALMTILVMEFTTSSALGYREAATQANELRASYLARSAIQVGCAMLEASALAQVGQPTVYDGLDQPWAQPIPPVHVDGGTVSLLIVDEARKLDINQLFDPRTRRINEDFAQVLARLFASVGVSTDLLPILVDWDDPDSVVSPSGAEADYYLGLMPPYEPRNGPMPTIYDLRAVKGMNDSTFRLLSNFLTAAPEPRVNANTASAQVLASLSPELSNSPELVESIIAARSDQPFVAVTDIANLPGIGTFANHITPMLTTRSSYFTLIGEGQFAGARKRIYAMFRRNLNGTMMLMSWHED
ncbi:MAG: type II secretion system minor pseudopilin GspK [Candidatus Binataceae bacterium]